MIEIVYFLTLLTFLDIIVDIVDIGYNVDIVDIDHTICQYCCINVKLYS